MKRNLAFRYGFSLLELMMVLFLMAMLALFALPNYQHYLQRKDLAQAKQQALDVVMHLERYKARNFSYRGFDLAELYPTAVINQNQVFIPLGSSSEQAKFILTVVDYDSLGRLNQTQQPPTATQRTGTDGVSSAATQDSSAALGRHWAISVERLKDDRGQLKQANNYDLLLTSTGIRCQTRTFNRVRDFRHCGTEDNQAW